MHKQSIYHCCVRHDVSLKSNFPKGRLLPCKALKTLLCMIMRADHARNLSLSTDYVTCRVDDLD